MNFRNFEAEEKLFARRTLVVTCFIILGVNLYRLQGRDHGYYQTRSNKNDIRMIPIAPPRGLIYERNGILLVPSGTTLCSRTTKWRICRRC